MSLHFWHAMTFNRIILLLSVIFFSHSNHAAGIGAIDDPTEEVSHTIGYKFKDPELLKLALTHSSYDVGTTVAAVGNERLEFLGDAVLEYGMKLRIFNWFGISSSFLNDATALLTENTVLATIADSIGLPTIALLPPTFASRTISNQVKPKADLVEALLGAIYLDGGLSAIEAFIEMFWFSDKAPGNYNTLFEDYKESETAITESFGYRFKTPWYLTASADSKSFPMEYLGKSILKFVVCEFLYRRFPELPPGDLTTKSQAFISNRNLSTVLGDRSLSLIGGVYLDGGLKAASQFILWNCTASTAPEEMREAVYRSLGAPISNTAIIYPMHIKETDPRFLLIEVLQYLEKTPTFETEELSKLATTEFTSQIMLDAKPISEKTRAFVRTKAEKKAAVSALEELSIGAFLNIGRASLHDATLNSYVSLLEGFLRALISSVFSYHQVVEHPSGESFRIEIQGKDIIPVIMQGPSLLSAQYKALCKVIISLLSKEYNKLNEIPVTERLELSNSLKLFKRILVEKLKQLKYEIEIKSILTEPKEGSSLNTCVIELSGPSRIISGSSHFTISDYGTQTYKGIGYSLDEAELRAIGEGFMSKKEIYRWASGVSIWSIFEEDVQRFMDAFKAKEEKDKMAPPPKARMID